MLANRISITPDLDGEVRFDIKFKGKNGGNTIAIFVDTKNYSGTSQIFKDLSQIKAYFNKISSFEEFIIVQQNRPGVSLTSLQNAFKNAILKEVKAVCYSYIRNFA